MKFEINKNSLVLFFEGKLDSSNVDKVTSEVEEVLLDKKFSNLILDFSNLNYISSAGSRLILKLKQKYENTSVIEVSLEVYETFEKALAEFKELVKKAKYDLEEWCGEDLEQYSEIDKEKEYASYEGYLNGDATNTHDYIKILKREVK